MTQSELKQKLYDLVGEYFGGATVTWGKVKAVSPNVPQVVLNMGAINRPYQPIKRIAGDVLVNSYPSRTTLQVDLYTKGAPTSTDPGMTAAYENTAVNDMTDFVNFLNSAYVDDWGDEHDVSILCRQVQDLTELINDVAWDYRAMVELEVGFTQSVVGHTGTMYEDGMAYHENGSPKYDADGNPLDTQGNPIPPELDEDGNPIPWPPPQFTETPSGGRTPELGNQYTGWFERVENPEIITKKEETG